ncbi:MAG: histidine phosphatase family protein, partial [Armatimonadetes bacterium]|nr:histidine phosphatase family protein [Candidatus Hippobium faecium]
MELYIVRHGETDCNKTNILQGMKIPSYLNEKGEKQAECVGRRLKNIKFDHIYCSDFPRAVKTAEIIKEELDCKPPLSERAELRERNYGDFEGHTWAEVRAILNTNAQRSVIEAPPNGESLYEVKERIENFIAFLKEVHKEKENILLVTHHGAVIMLFVCLLGLTLKSHRNFYFDNCSVS